MVNTPISIAATSRAREMVILKANEGEFGLFLVNILCQFSPARSDRYKIRIESTDQYVNFIMMKNRRVFLVKYSQPLPKVVNAGTGRTENIMKECEIASETHLHP